MRPLPSDADPYYFRYIDLVPEGDIVATLAVQMHETQALLLPLPATRADHRYAPGKWSIKELLLHLSDAERVFAYRMLHFARGDQGALPSMEQDDWARGNDHGHRTLPDVVAELRAVREATLQLLRTLTPAMLERAGTASGKRFVARAIPWIIAGHERHHLRVLRERYL